MIKPPSGLDQEAYLMFIIFCSTILSILIKAIPMSTSVLIGLLLSVITNLMSLKDALIGFGDIGRCVARKCLAFNLDVNVSDPGFFHDMNENGKIKCKYIE